MASYAPGPGVFPDCGCHYTANDDGIHFCKMHKAAPDLLAACRAALAVMTGPYYGGAPGTTDTCTTLRAAIEKVIEQRDELARRAEAVLDFVEAEGRDTGMGGPFSDLRDAIAKATGE